jgi:hypothetical protein
MSRNVRRIEIRQSMACVAGKSRSTVPIGPTHDQRLMWAHAIGLVRTVASGVTIHTARMLQHLAGFPKQCDRAGVLIGNSGKRGRRPQIT